MDNLSDWIYVIILVGASVVSSFTKRKAKKGAEANTETPDETTTTQPKNSWEELMRELKKTTEAATQPPQAETVTTMRPEPNVREKATVRETIQSQKDRKKERQKAKTESTIFQPSMSKSAPIAEADIENTNVWALHTLDDAKRAFVYSEIFNRKY